MDAFPDFAHIRYAVGNGIAEVVLARPDKRNALGVGPGSSREEIAAALRRADADDEVGCILVHAEGDSFCGGGDLSGAPTGGGPADDVDLVADVDDFHASIRSVGTPVVVAVQGHCLGAGLGMVINADLVLAADDARFGLPEGRFGHPGGAELAGVIGAAWAKFLIFTGESIGADRAVAVGLALVVIPRADLLERARDLSRRIASLPRTSLSLNKRAIDSAIEASGASAGRTAGRAIDALTKVISHEASAPDGRRFEDVLVADGVAGLKEAMNHQFSGTWLDTLPDRGRPSVRSPR